jgi:FKBP12-rapamycin complex-associated protein
LPTDADSHAENAESSEMLKKARQVIDRINNKLTGRDFNIHQVLDVPEQVDKLIRDATSVENLCALYIGWCAFW